MKLFPITADVWSCVQSSADSDDYVGVVMGTFILLFAPVIDILRWIAIPPVNFIGRILSAIFRHRY